MNAVGTRIVRPLKWRGWSRDGTSLGVCEAKNAGEAAEKFRQKFGERFDLITTAFFGAEATV